MLYKKIGIGLLSVYTSCSLANIDNFASNVPDNAKPSQSFHELMADAHNEMAQKGYIESYSTKYEYLTNLETKLNYDLKGDIRSTGLKENASDVVTYIQLKHVQPALIEKTLGFAPVGSFNKDHGWTGITQIFRNKSAGLCQFTHLNLKASGGGYSINEEQARTDVNGHYTGVEITGKKDSGFDYEVTWFNDLNMYRLNCVHKTFSKDFENNVIALAQQVDES